MPENGYIFCHDLVLYYHSIFFFCFAKKFSITKQDIGPFYDGAGDLITDKSEISQLLLEKFSSVFSTPSTDKKVTDPDSFFTYNIDGKPLLTDIIIDDEHIVSAVKEMSVSSSAGPDGLPFVFPKKLLTSRVGVKYSTCTWYLYLSTYLSVLDVLEYLVYGNVKVLVLVLDQKVLGTYK